MNREALMERRGKTKIFVVVVFLICIFWCPFHSGVNSEALCLVPEQPFVVCLHQPIGTSQDIMMIEIACEVVLILELVMGFHDDVIFIQNI